MTGRYRHRRFWLAACLPLALVACGSKDDAQENLDTLDAELTNSASSNAGDPVLMGALQDQIMVDPALAGQANNDAIRPPAKPLAGPVPTDTGGGDVKTGPLQPAPAPRGDCPECRTARASLTLGALAGHQKIKGIGDCVGSLHYSAAYAERLPAALPLYPDARVSEAAGSDTNGCALRAVSFVSSAPLQTLLDWYYTRATKAGYAAQHQADGDQHVLGGTQGDAAFALFVTARRDGGSDVDLIANTGR